MTLRTHASGPADELFVDVRAASFVSAIKDAMATCPGLGPFVLMRAVPWPRGVSCAEDAAKKLAVG